MLEFYTTATPIARKVHICDLCNGKIQAGEKYTRFSGKNDGEVFDIKHHLLCAEIIRQYCEFVGDNEYDVDSVHEWVEETVCSECEHYDGNSDSRTPCKKSMFCCPKAIERFSKKQGE